MTKKKINLAIFSMDNMENTSFIYHILKSIIYY